MSKINLVFNHEELFEKHRETTLQLFKKANEEAFSVIEKKVKEDFKESVAKYWHGDVLVAEKEGKEGQVSIYDKLQHVRDISIHMNKLNPEFRDIKDQILFGQVRLYYNDEYTDINISLSKTSILVVSVKNPRTLTPVSCSSMKQESSYFKTYSFQIPRWIYLVIAYFFLVGPSYQSLDFKLAHFPHFLMELWINQPHLFQTSSAPIVQEYQGKLEDIKKHAQESAEALSEISALREEIRKEREVIESQKLPYISMESVREEQEKIRIEKIKLQQIKRDAQKSAEDIEKQAQDSAEDRLKLNEDIKKHAQDVTRERSEISAMREELRKEREAFESQKLPYISMESVREEQEKIRIEKIKLQQIRNKLKAERALLNREKEEWERIMKETHSDISEDDISSTTLPEYKE